jgi:Histidine kinase-like ATPase domain
LIVALVELSFPARPVHVRTARQVAVSLARRAQLADEVLDEIRLAVAEACGLALAVLRQARDDGPVAVVFDDSDGFTVEVRTAAVLPVATGAAALDVVADIAKVAAEDDEQLPAGAALAVLAEFAPVLDAATSAQGLRLRLGWPAAADLGPTGRTA